MTEFPLTSTKPYLIRAIYEWICDNECTPYVVVNAEAKDVEVPQQYIEDGRIVLNISEFAVRDLIISNEYLEFNARFDGVASQIYAPISAVAAIYAHENGHGMVFSEEEAPSAPSLSDEKEIKRPEPGTKPVLKVIK